MNRRNFLQRLFITPIVAAIKLPVKPIKTAYDKLFGIPYHENNATTGTWMGFDRSSMPQWSSKPGSGKPISKEMIELIRKLMKDAMDNDYKKRDW